MDTVQHFFRKVASGKAGLVRNNHDHETAVIKPLDRLRYAGVNGEIFGTAAVSGVFGNRPVSILKNRFHDVLSERC
jgi:hypothetical protein